MKTCFGETHGNLPMPDVESARMLEGESISCAASRSPNGTSLTWHLEGGEAAGGVCELALGSGEIREQRMVVVSY